MSNYSGDVDLVFSALADRTRRAVVHRLSSGPRSVSELAGDFPIALPSFMKHIATLEASGLIRTRKTGRVRSCELNRAALGAIEHWLEVQRRSWEQQTDRLQAFAENEARHESEHDAEPTTRDADRRIRRITDPDRRIRPITDADRRIRPITEEER
ncbi:MAG: helix-turn-helix transcriptional regulator [Actinobacteria bacterium]|nr:helix-turn-helix transcriptional regulator [Actinomycetota bacterium]